MGLRLLIASPRQAQRERLCAIYSTSPLVTHIDEATNSEELHSRLENVLPDFVVIHQSLITKPSLLPKGHFVIIVAEPDWYILKAACKHGIRGYFLENPLPLEDLLTTSLTLRGEQCLLDPRLTSWALQRSSSAEPLTISAFLSLREQQILALWNEHLSSSIIGQRLAIKGGTVKKHLENIRKKLREHNSSAMMRRGV